MLHDPELIRLDLSNLSSTLFATKWFFDTRPYVFESNEDEYIKWRHIVADGIEVDPSDILITGSACLGFSLSPYKNFKRFDEKSDIDLCIFSEYYFNLAWRELSSKTMIGLTPKMITSIKEHREKYIYWGTIATDIILPLLSFGPSWERIIPKLSPFKCLEDHEIHFRIYKDRQSFRRYLLQSIEYRKNAIMEDLENE